MNNIFFWEGQMLDEFLISLNIRYNSSPSHSLHTLHTDRQMLYTHTHTHTHQHTQQFGLYRAIEDVYATACYLIIKSYNWKLYFLFRNVERKFCNSNFVCKKRRLSEKPVCKAGRKELFALIIASSIFQRAKLLKSV